MSHRGEPRSDRLNPIYLFWRSIVAPAWRAWWNARDDLASDADGRAHRILESRRDSESAAAIRRVRDRLSSQFPKAARVNLLAVGTLLGAAVFVAVAGVRAFAWPGGRITGLLLLMTSPTFLIGAWIYIRQKRTLLRWWPIEQVRDAWIAEGGCPACGYTLPPGNAADGIVVCTECGTRWWRSRPGLTP